MEVGILQIKNHLRTKDSVAHKVIWTSQFTLIVGMLQF